MLTGSPFRGPEFSHVNWLISMSSLNQDILDYHLIWPSLNLCISLIVDADGTGQVNWKGVGYYNRLINYMLKKGKISMSMIVILDRF